jgi:hypothetical protein
MPASRAGGPRRGARVEHEQGEGPLYIPRWMCVRRAEDAPPEVGMGELL